MTRKKEIKTIKLRLYGESFKINKLSLNGVDKTRVDEVCRRLKEPLECALLNVSFYSRLQLKSHQTIEDFIAHSFGGLINSPKNKIEIWSGRKCLQKCNIETLFSKHTLFPVFNIQHSQVTVTPNNELLFLEKEVGFIGEYLIECPQFNIDLLQFNISDLVYDTVSYQVLSGIQYNSVDLSPHKSDTLVTYRYCVNNLKPAAIPY